MEASPLDEQGLCLLSLDGGGVRGLSSLYILRKIMADLNDERKKHGLPPRKPCEVFDLIGGTSTGGLIAIMLGRLEMDVDECITAYGKLSESVFSKKIRWSRFDIWGTIKPRFDSDTLRKVIDDVIADRGIGMSDLLNDKQDRGCRVFVCATSTNLRSTQRLRSYDLAKKQRISATITEAALATSAATGFFRPVTIGDIEYVDGALGANNPVGEVEGEATDIWCQTTGDLKPLVKCFISIGTGNTGAKSISEKLPRFVSKTLVALATQTEDTAATFVRRWRQHYDQSRYFRFNVEQGLQDVGLAEFQKHGRIEVATTKYLETLAEERRLEQCVNNLKGKQSAHQRATMDLQSIINANQGQSQSEKEPGYSGPPTTTRYFVGREKAISKMYNMLFGEDPYPRVALFGLGGIGKTQTALQLARRARERKPEFSQFWVSALSANSFEQSYAAIATELGIRTDDKEFKSRVREFLSSKNAGQWLIIVDNVDDEELAYNIDRHLPESADGRFLFTTRSKKVAMSMSQDGLVDLDKMDPEEARMFLEKSLHRTIPPQDDVVVQELLQELTYLPLAIAQATAFIRQNEISIAEYLRLLRGTQEDMVELLTQEFHDRTRYGGSQNAVATTWTVSFNQIRRNNPSAAHLLGFISCIEPKAIPRLILPIKTSEADLTRAIGTLCTYTFLARRGEQDVYDMHSLVHLATRIWVRESELTRQTARDACDQLAKVFPRPSYEKQAVWREYLPHAISVVKAGEQIDTEESIGLRRRVGVCFWRDGRHSMAIELLETAYRLARERLPEDNETRIRVGLGLGTTYSLGGHLQKGLSLLRQAVVVLERTRPENDPVRLDALYYLAAAYRVNGEGQRAKKILKNVVQLQRSLLGNNQLRLYLESELAAAYLENGQVIKGIEILQHVVATRKECLPEDHPSRLISEHNLGVAYNKTGQKAKAVELFRHVVAVQRKTLSEGHPDRQESELCLRQCQES